MAMYRKTKPQPVTHCSGGRRPETPNPSCQKGSTDTLADGWSYVAFDGQSDALLHDLAAAIRRFRIAPGEVMGASRDRVGWNTSFVARVYRILGTTPPSPRSLVRVADDIGRAAALNVEAL
jgi:hypothetical protein